MLTHMTEKAFQKRTVKKEKRSNFPHQFNLCPWNGLDVFDNLDDDGGEIVCYGCIFISRSSLGVHFRPVIYHQGYQVLIFDSRRHNL